MTTDGVACVFPFVFEGKTHAACTNLGNNGVRWCATTASYDQDEEWGDCVDTCAAGNGTVPAPAAADAATTPLTSPTPPTPPTPTSTTTSPTSPTPQTCTTTDGVACVFPFVIEGVAYAACTDLGNNGVQWCATTPNYDQDEEWGDCADTCAADNVPMRAAAAVAAEQQKDCTRSSLVRGAGRCGCIHELGLSGGSMACREAKGKKYWFPESNCLAAATHCMCEQTQYVLRLCARALVLPPGVYTRICVSEWSRGTTAARPVKHALRVAPRQRPS